MFVFAITAFCAELINIETPIERQIAVVALLTQANIAYINGAEDEQLDIWIKCTKKELEKDTNLEILASQNISFIEFDKKVSEYKKDKTSFGDVMKDVKSYFGLMAKDDPDSGSNKKLVLSAYELEQIEAAYEKSVNKVKTYSSAQEEIMYGSYEPLTVTLTHILNQKAGIGWSSYSHTGMPVPVFAMGVGQELFTGFFDNTDIFLKYKELTKVE